MDQLHVIFIMRALTFFFPLFSCTWGIWKLLGQGWNPSCRPMPHPMGYELHLWPMLQLVAPDLFFFFLIFFLGSHPQHMEVPRLGVQTEMKLSACVTATATQDLICICNLHNAGSLTHWARPGIKPTSSQRQCCVLNPLNHNRNSLTFFLIYRLESPLSN